MVFRKRNGAGFRTWLRYSIRGLLVAVVGICAALAYYRHVMEREAQNARLVAHHGGYVQMQECWLGLSFVTQVECRGTSITNRDLQLICRSSRIERLFIGDTQVTNSGLRYLKGLRNLKSLDLKNTHVSDAGIRELQTITQLGSLVLSGTLASDEQLAQMISANPALINLDVSHTRANCKVAFAIANSELLEWCDLSDTEMDDACVDALVQNSNLKAVFLAGTAITEKAASELAAMKQLQVLDISRTHVDSVSASKLSTIHPGKEIVWSERRPAP